MRFGVLVVDRGPKNLFMPGLVDVNGLDVELRVDVEGAATAATAAEAVVIERSDDGFSHEDTPVLLLYQ